MKFHTRMIFAIIILLNLFINPASSQTAEEWMNNGNSLYDLGDYDKAVEAYDKAIAIDPNLLNAWISKGSALIGLSKYNKAIEAYDRAIAIDPNESYAWVGKGHALYFLGEYDKAMEAYDKAIALDSNDKDAWLGKGFAFNYLGKYNNAVEAFDKAIAIDPNIKDAWLGKGDSLNALGEYNKAIEAYDRAIAIDPNSKVAKKNKELTINKTVQMPSTQSYGQDNWNLFWESIEVGISTFSYLQVWIAIVFYMLAMGAYFFSISIFFGNDEKERLSASIYYIFSGTIFQVGIMVFVVAYLTPFLLFGGTTFPISWILSNIWSIIMVGIISILILMFLKFLPIINVFAGNPAFQPFLLGIINFRLLSETSVINLLTASNVKGDVYPGFLLSICLIIAGSVISYLLFSICLIIISIFKKNIPSINDEYVETFIVLVILPLIIFIPLFVYSSYVHLSLMNLLS